MPGSYQLFSIPWRDKAKTWEMHHAAVFALVRWSNIYDSSSWIFRGDLIAGPLQDAFGPGIIDVDLKVIRGPVWHFSHADYWKSGSDTRQLKVLRDAINLLDRPPSEVTFLS